MSDPIDALPPLRDVITQHDLRAEKKFGQNFLLDMNITDKIARAAGDLSRHHVIEIGPGPGGLTRSLIRAKAKHVTAIEFDPRAVKALQELVMASEGRLSLLEADALRVDLTAIGDVPRIIVANLPYNIATVLLTSWLAQLRRDGAAFSLMVLMFQKEVVERMIAPPGDGTYGRLSVLVQWLCHAERLFDLPPGAFTPPPKVTSSIVRLTPKILPEDSPSLKAVETVTAAAFGQRRKMLKSSLKHYPGLLDCAGIDETLRPEQVDVDGFLRMAKCLERQRQP